LILKRSDKKDSRRAQARIFWGAKTGGRKCGCLARGGKSEKEGKRVLEDECACMGKFEEEKCPGGIGKGKRVLAPLTTKYQRKTQQKELSTWD